MIDRDVIPGRLVGFQWIFIGASTLHFLYFLNPGVQNQNFYLRLPGGDFVDAASASCFHIVAFTPRISWLPGAFGHMVGYLVFLDMRRRYEARCNRILRSRYIIWCSKGSISSNSLIFVHVSAHFFHLCCRILLSFSTAEAQGHHGSPQGK